MTTRSVIYVYINFLFIYLFIFIRPLLYLKIYDLCFIFLIYFYMLNYCIYTSLFI